jgi:acetyltransferase-like isoleucine patch superfamily enzyme
MLPSYVGKSARIGRKGEIGYGSFVEDGAQIGDNARIGNFVHVFPGAAIGDNCLIGDMCSIGHPNKIQLQKTDFSSTSPKVKEFVIIDPATKIGDESIIRSGSIIYAHTNLGRKLRTGHHAIIREHVTIGSNCVIGTQAILDGYLKIGEKSMIQSQCYITQSVKIGKGVFIAPKCVFLDNKKIILGEGLSGIILEDYVRIGGGTKILPEITIGKHALIGAGSVVTKNLPPKAIAYGTPAQVKGYQSDREIQDYITSVMKWE